jgi:hypothetical protein
MASAHSKVTEVTLRNTAPQAGTIREQFREICDTNAQLAHQQH